MSTATSFPLDFTVPNNVLSKSIYASVYGTNPLNGDFIVLAPSTIVQTTTLSTELVKTLAPVQHHISVSSVTGFPSSGKLSIIESNLEIEVSYTGIDTTNNQFTGVTYLKGTAGMGIGATVSVHIAYDEDLKVDDVTGFSSSGELMLQTPTNYLPSQNVVLAYTGVNTVTNTFTGVSLVTGSEQLPSGIPSGGTVMQLGKITDPLSYQTVSSLEMQNAPLLAFPTAAKPAEKKPSKNPITHASIPLPFPTATTHHIKSGVIVLSVGSAMALPITPKGTLAVPTALTNEYDKFGLLEITLNDTLVDFDLSYVDQAAFPMQLTCKGSTPPAPASASLGVGSLQTRATMFSEFDNFLANRSSGSNATAFDSCKSGVDNFRLTAPNDVTDSGPLDSYFNDAIKDFFDFYKNDSGHPTLKKFVFDDSATNTKWVGYTKTQTAAEGGFTYLALTGEQGQYGNQFSGDTLNVLLPFFKENMGSGYPAAPSWYTNVYDAQMSPSNMIFGATGIFGSVVSPASTLPLGNAKDVYNGLVAAITRGLTPRKNGTGWDNVIPPNYWSAAPLLSSASATNPGSGGKLSTGNYRYGVTAVAVNTGKTSGEITEATDKNPIVVTSAAHGLVSGDFVAISGVKGNTAANGRFEVDVIDANSFSIPAQGNNKYTSGGSWTLETETSMSNPLELEVASANNSVELQWPPFNGPGSSAQNTTANAFNIYRSEKTGNDWGAFKWIGQVQNNVTTPVHTFLDNVATASDKTPQFSYFADGQLSNQYAAYFSQLDVSINGLSYSFPYSDNGNLSTNIQMNMGVAGSPTGLKVTLLDWE